MAYNFRTPCCRAKWEQMNNKQQKEEDTIPNNVIKYTASQKLEEIGENDFGAIIINHIFKDGIGIVTFNEDIRCIPAEAFIDCESLISIIIPNSVTSIEGAVFSGCYNLVSITIPDGITLIEHDTFFGCSSLTSVVIPSNITSIGYSAFDGCSSLTFVTIPNSVTSIEGYAFNSCSLISVTIPSSVTSIGECVFSSCSSLTSVTIGNSVTSIGDWAFSSCSGLTSITIEAITPPVLGENIFDNTNNCLIYVPSESVDAYKAATGWSTYADRIQAIPQD